MTNSFDPKEYKWHHVALPDASETVRQIYRALSRNVDNIYHLTANNGPSYEAHTHS